MYHRIAVLLAMLFWIATALLAQDATELASRANPVTPDAWLSRQGWPCFPRCCTIALDILIQSK